MESFIVVFVIIFLIGAVSFLKPSKKMKALSQVRMAAAKEGFKIGSTNQLRKKFKNWNPQVAIYQFKNLSESSLLIPNVVWVESLVPKLKKSACLEIFFACSAALGNSIIVPTV